MEKRVRLLISDLDNTLYDWVSSFVPALLAMIAEASQILNVSDNEMREQLKRVHQKHSNSEHPFALLETEIVRNVFSGDTIIAKRTLDPAFHAFNRVRKELLSLYPGVNETLTKLKSSGILVVGHTDARISNSAFRVHKLGLSEHLDALYAPSSVMSNDQELAKYAFPPGFIRQLPPDDKKPNPHVVLDICNALGVSPHETIYIGDSMVRDVYMAKKAGGIAAWARYGTHYDRQLWNELVTVSHWTEDDVIREANIRDLAKGTEPDYVIDNFSDIIHIAM